jgi:hypothetical protein
MAESSTTPRLEPDEPQQQQEDMTTIMTDTAQIQQVVMKRNGKATIRGLRTICEEDNNYDSGITTGF